ncbi:MAG: 2-aminoethylphosphonate--pyruvate transaminase, partial [Coprobacillus sp.]
IRRQLLELAHVSEEDYTTVLMQGSGTFGVESVITSVVGDNEKILIVANGAYGDRMCDMCNHARVNYTVINFAEDENPDADAISEV